MVQLRISLTEDAKRAIAKARERPVHLARELRPAVDRAAAQLASDVGEHEFGPGKTLNVVTGMLRRSIRHRVGGGKSALLVAIGVTRGPATKYAAIHEHGGTITPTKAKYLAIPLQRAAGGRPRFPGGPRSVPGDTFVLKAKSGNLFIVRAKRVRGKPKGKVTGLEFLFLLRKSVRIPARHWLSEGVRRQIGAFEVSLQDDVDRILKAK